MSESSYRLPEDETPEQLVAALAGLLELEAIEENLFRGPVTHEPWTRVFGGQVVGQALMAACRTVDTSERLPHSLHAYFMRPGDATLPIVYQVHRDRDGGSFTSRRVVAIQHGKPILNLACSFQVREEGLRHQADMPDMPGPEGLAEERELMLRYVDLIPEKRRPHVFRQRPIEFRPVEQRARINTEPREPHQAFWFRAVGPVRDDQVLHRGMLAYASDMALLGTSLRPHGIDWFKDTLQEASLDHAVWIHDDVRIDEWMLYTQDSPWSGGGRGMNRGLIYAADGRLVASVAQEGLIRIPRPRAG